VYLFFPVQCEFITPCSHPHEYTVAPESAPYSYFAENGNDDAEIQPYFDRQGQVAFYTIRFRPQ
jgi:hypothetical protein